MLLASLRSTGTGSVIIAAAVTAKAAAAKAAAAKAAAKAAAAAAACYLHTGQQKKQQLQQ